MAQLVTRPTSGQVMILQFTSWSPALGSVLTAQSLEPASDSTSLSTLPPLTLLYLKNKTLKKKQKLDISEVYVMFSSQ